MGNGKGGFLNPGRGILIKQRGSRRKGWGILTISREISPPGIYYRAIQRYRDTKIQRYNSGREGNLSIRQIAGREKLTERNKPQGHRLEKA